MGGCTRSPETESEHQMGIEGRDLDPIVVELRRIRTDARIPQNKFADQLGIGASRFSSYENGTSPQLSVLRYWAAALGRDLVLAGDDKIPAARPTGDTVQVELSRYQIALAMGMLIAASYQNEGQLSADLKAVADALARAMQG